MKRVLLFLATNMAIILMLTLILKLTGLEHYINNEFGLEYGALAIFSFIFGMAGSVTSLLLSKYIAKKSMGVILVNDDLKFRGMIQMVQRIADKANISMPEVGVYNSPEINAFATGPSKNNSLVAVSSGLLEKMDEDEIYGVLAHEVGHIANGDMVTMTLLQGVLNTFVIFLSRVLANIFTKSEDGRSGFAYFGVVIILQIAFGFIASLIVAAFSRHREYRADLAGSQLSTSHAMIKALKRLKNDVEVASMIKRDKSIAAFQITNVTGLFSTHPPLGKRIKALEQAQNTMNN